MESLRSQLQRTKTQFVNELADKTKIASPFLVKYSVVAVGKTGKPYMNLILSDKTGEIDARVWEEVPKHAGQAVQDAFIWVEGHCQVYQGRKQIVVRSIQVLREDEVQVDEFLKESRLDAEALYSKLKSYVGSMKDPHYKALAESILIEDNDVVERIKRAPAAKSVHHAYPVGLLEHVVSITDILNHLADHYAPFVDRDLLFLGGFLHDIAKIWELSYDRVTDYTMEGKLIGHLVMGVELVNRKIALLEAQEGRLPSLFSEEKKLLIKHMILAHHGELEYGSPKRPKCLEALIVHFIDNLDSKVNAIKEFTLMDQTPGEFTGLNRQYGRYFYKPEWARVETPGAPSGQS